MRRITWSIVLGIGLALVRPPAATDAALPYVGCFREDDLPDRGRPDLLLVGTAFELAGTGEEGRPTAYLIHPDTVILGNPADPFWAGGEDASHFPRFILNDRIVVARWGMSYEDPALGTSDLAGCFWVVKADGRIDYTRSPKLNGLRPATLSALLTALSGQPNTALRGGPSPMSLPVLVGLCLLLLSGWLAARRFENEPGR